MVMSNGQISPPARYAMLTLSWPLPSRMEEQEAALGMLGERGQAQAAQDATALVALADRTRGTANGDPLAAGEAAGLLRAADLVSPAPAVDPSTPTPTTTPTQPQTATTATAVNVPPSVFSASASTGPGDPGINAVQDATLRFNRLAPDDLDSLAERARYGALLPQLSVSFDRTVRRQDSLLASDLTGERLDLLAGAGYSAQARATWHLDRVVYDPAEVRVAYGAARMSRERAALLLEVTTLYYKRARLLRDAANASPEANPNPEIDIDIDETSAEIDALCGGCLESPEGDP
jgi:hypothetical protein